MVTTVKRQNLVKSRINALKSMTFSAVCLFLAATAPSLASADTLPKVSIQTSEGAMQLTLRPDVAPETVENFLAYVDSGFYEGTIFHRVIPGFMIQGGGFDASMNRKQTRDPVRNEAVATLKNLRGTIAMARTNDPDSATSQFFINVVDNPFLNAGVRGAGYTVFGRVTEGMGVVDAIAAKQTGRRNGMSDVPMQAVTIERVTRVDADQQ